jgi:V/A-type H+/Na+-transporting ATPase subunit E
MKKLESGQDQLQRICDTLRHDTLAPALAEARRIEAEAQQTAHRLVEEAQRKASERETVARERIKQEQEIFQQNLQQALKQAVALLRQEVEHSLLRKGVAGALRQPMSRPDLMAHLVEAMVEAIRKEGIDADLSVEVGKAISKEDLVKALGESVLEEIHKGRIVTASFPTGIAVKIEGEDVTLDMSESALKEWLARFLRKDFRDVLFGS